MLSGSALTSSSSLATHTAVLSGGSHLQSRHGSGPALHRLLVRPEANPGRLCQPVRIPPSLRRLDGRHLRTTYLQAEKDRCVAKGRPILLREPILVDDNRDAAMLAAIEEAFRVLRSGRDPEAILTDKPKFRDSEIDETLQLADMVMGAIGAHLDGENEWYDYIRGNRRDLGVVNLAGGGLLASDHLSEVVDRI